MRGRTYNYLAVVVAALVAASGCEPRSQDLADGWREMLRSVLPSDATGLRVLANHYDNGVGIFEVHLPPQDPVAVLANIRATFAEKYPGYVVAKHAAGMLRLRCRPPAARHWHSMQYEFHVCKQASVVIVGMWIANDMTDQLRTEYEAEALELAGRASGHAGRAPSNNAMQLTRGGLSRVATPWAARSS